MKMDDRRIQEAMKKLNLKVREVKAEEVIIKCKDKNIIVSKPEIMIADMMGREVYQITGEVSESTRMSEQDVQLVMEKTGKDRDTVVKTLERLDHDLAKAIMELTE